MEEDKKSLIDAEKVVNSIVEFTIIVISAFILFFIIGLVASLF